MDANESGPPGNANDQEGQFLVECGGTETKQIITHAAEQIKPYSYRTEALRELAGFTAYQQWKRRRRLKERE